MLLVGHKTSGRKKRGERGANCGSCANMENPVVQKKHIQLNEGGVKGKVREVGWVGGGMW